MGQEVCRAIEAAADLTLVAAVDPHHAGTPLDALAGTATGLELQEDFDVLAATQADVAVDFTMVEAARENLDYCAANAIHAVVGTTGFTDADLTRYRSEFSDSNCLIAPNFAIGAVLMMRFAELAAPFFESAEVIELHHDAKIDAPSGTAMMTLERMAAASADWGRDPTEHEVVPGSRGGKGPGDIPVHSLRLRGLVAHQEVLFGTTGQTLSIRHDSIDRTSFMPGVVLGVRRIVDFPGVTVGLDAVLGL